MSKTPCSASKRFLAVIFGSGAYVYVPYCPTSGNSQTQFDTIEDAKCGVERWFSSQGLNSANSSGYRAFVIDTQTNTIVATVNVAPKPLLNWSDEAPSPTPDQPTTATE